MIEGGLNKTMGCSTVTVQPKYQLEISVVAQTKRTVDLSKNSRLVILICPREFDREAPGSDLKGIDSENTDVEDLSMKQKPATAQ